MDTYYIRHTAQLDIDGPTRRSLWDERRIAIHFPQYKSGQNPHGEIPKGKPDNASLDLDDYPSRGRRALHALSDLAKNGGYVCAEYHGHKECLLGYVSPDSNIELTRGKWGSRNECDGRQAILKTLRLKKVKLVSPSDFAVIFVGRPRQGTIMRWPRAGKTIENSVEGRHPIPAIGDLSPDQQEIMCAEFLRSASTEQFGLPKLAHLLLPVGRTMKGIDICGITDTGTMVFGQVTFANVENCNHKIQALGQFHEPRWNVLVLCCDCAGPSVIDGIQIVPLQAVYNSFIDTRTGKLWIERATSLAFK
jgi:hypothetical protein